MINLEGTLGSLYNRPDMQHPIELQHGWRDEDGQEVVIVTETLGAWLFGASASEMCPPNQITLHLPHSHAFLLNIVMSVILGDHFMEVFDRAPLEMANSN